MKRIISLLLISALAFSFAACEKVEDTRPEESITDMTAEVKEMFASPEDAIMNCIEVEYPTFEYEFSASAYKEFGTDETDDTLTVYGLGLTENFRFEGDNFIVDNLYNYFPFILKMSKHTNDRGLKYKVDDYQTFIFDYTESSTDYHEYFPAEYSEKLDSFERLSDFGLTETTNKPTLSYRIWNSSSARRKRSPTSRRTSLPAGIFSPLT